ncbi:MAG TPA: hypothetical protein VK891_13665, partial [Euzebyales bacterium]|nr:hypothetical protein [Euzebyales bacterium]
DVALMGLRGGDRTLLDGIHVPATIAPGDMGRMYVPAIDRSAIPSGALMVLGGVVHAPLDGTDDPFPEDGFTLVAPIAGAGEAP